MLPLMVLEGDFAPTVSKVAPNRLAAHRPQDSQVEEQYSRTQEQGLKCHLQLLFDDDDDMMLFVLFCDAWTRIRVRCAVDEGCTIHDYTAKNKTSPLVLSEHEKEQKFNTWYVTCHRTRPPCGRHHVLQGDSHLFGSLAHVLALETKSNTHRSILSDKKNTSHPW